MMNFTQKIFSLSFFLLVGTLAFSQTPFWTEDFDGAIPADWTPIEVAGDGSATSNWVWTDLGPAGSYATDPINSTSAGNGWVVFDSDLNCSGEQDVWLQSPELDLSDKDIVWLQFENYYLRFSDAVYVEVSTNGVDWTQLELFPNVTNNQFGDGAFDAADAANPHVVELDLSTYAANQSSFWFAFHFLSDASTQIGMAAPGCGYSWQIDDVALYDEALGGGTGGDDVIWGGSEDPNGSFDGGLNDWTLNPVSNPDAVWVWDAEGDASEGAYWGSRGPIQSPSVANGAAVFNSDFYDNDGVQGNFGNGIAAAPHVSELLSPIIDLTDNLSVSLQFNQYYRNFQATVFVAYSNDGGASWSDPIQLNEDVAVNAETSPADVQFVPLFGAGGTDQFRVKFIFDGEYYFWIVDDVAIVERPEYDLALGDFFYPPASYAQPESQIDIDTMGFSVDVSNLGGLDQTNVSLIAQVLDESGAVIFEDELIIDNLAAGVRDSTFALPNQFVPNDANGIDVGVYEITYSISSDNEDFNEADNDVREEFLVTSDLYSKENGDAAEEVGFQPGGGGDFSVANLYLTGENWVGDYYAKTVTFAVVVNAADPLEGKEVDLFLMKVNDDVDAEWNNFEVNTTDVASHPNMELVGIGDFTYTSEASGDLINVELLDINTIEPDVKLEPNTRYFIVASYVGDDNNTVFQVFNQEINYFQISTAVVSSQWFLGGFGEENAALLRMDIAFVNSADEELLPEEVLNFYPNPVSDVLNVEVSFDQPQLANVVIADINGKVIMIDELLNASDERRQYNVSNLSAGTYLLRVATEEGTRTKQFVIQR